MRAIIFCFFITLVCSLRPDNFFKRRDLNAFGGFWFGFMKGLYHRTGVIDSSCISNETIKRYQNVWDLFQETPGIDGDMFTMIGDIAFVVNNLSSCGFRKPYNDIRDFCKDRFEHYRY